MSLNWINPNDYSFNSFLLLERFQIRMMMDSCGWRNDDEEWKRCMGIALNANPAVKWYLMHRCPECSALVEELVAKAPAVTETDQIRKAEVYTLLSIEDFKIHTTPEHMASNCDYIRGWSKERLFEMADFTGKIVLDVGAGSGRLTFTAAEKAAWVYASEPVGTLREFMRDKINKAPKQLDVNVYDTIIIGGSVYVGKVSKTLRAFCESNLDTLLEKRVGVFLCSALADQFNDTLLKSLLHVEKEAVYKQNSRLSQLTK